MRSDRKRLFRLHLFGVGLFLGLATLAGMVAGAAFAGEAAIGWHEGLSLGGGDVWRARIPVDVVNRRERDLRGVPLSLEIGREPGQMDLVGVPARSIRVTDAGGTELLFDLRSPQGLRLRDGAIPQGAVLTVPVTVGESGRQRLYVHFDNPSAYPVPDFLTGGTRSSVPAALAVTVGAVERLELAWVTGETEPFPGWEIEPGRTWEIRIPLTVTNTSESAQETVVQASLARLKALGLRGFNLDSLRVVDPQSGVVHPTRVAGDNLVFVAHLPARSVKRFYIYLSRDPEIGGGPILDYTDLVAHPGNRVVNPSFEEGGEAPDGWTRLGAHLSVVEMPNGGPVGRRFARITVPESVTPDWTGWRQTVAVEPGARYVFFAYVRVTGVSRGGVRLHAHILDETERKFWSAGPELAGTTNWTLLGGVINVSSRAREVELHLTMDAHGTLDHDGVVLMRAALAHQGEIEVNPSLASQTSQPLWVWQENPIVKVFQDTPPDWDQVAAFDERSDGITLYAARGEKEALQLVLRSNQELQVTVAVEGLRSGDAQLPAPEIGVVGYVPVLQPTGYYHAAIERNDWERLSASGSERTDGWQGWWPDYVLPVEGAVELSAHRTQPLWITFTVPQDAPPGRYTGTIRITGDGIEKEIPLSLVVWRFVLPERPSLQAVYDLRSGPGWSIAQSERERDTWWRFMSERRVSADNIWPEPEFRIVDGQVVMDATAFDKAAEHYFNELNMAAAYFPGIFYAAGWAHPPKSFLGRPYGTEPYREAYRQALTLFWNHVKSKGWADRMVLYLSDEPFYDRPEVVQWLGEIIRLIREVDPAIPVYASTWGFVPEWEGLLNHWGAAQDERFPVEILTRRVEAGDKVWFTTDGHMEINTPFSAIERVLPYYAFTYGVDGYEFWGISWYTYNPFEYGWHSFIRQSEGPGEEFWARYPHGDGYLAYPGEMVGLSGPVSTIRLEQAREGLEDYEIYAALRRMAELRPEWNELIGPVLDEVRRLGALPNTGGFLSTQVLPDPDRLLEARVRAGELLDEILASIPGAAVSGRVVDPLGRGLEGVEISVSGGAEGTVTSGAGGRWRLDDVRGYAVIGPKVAGWTFLPNQVTVSAGEANVEFLAMPPDPKVSIVDGTADGRREDSTGISWRDGSTVSGEIEPRVLVELPGPPAKSEVASVIVSFAGEPVYEGSRLPEGLRIDTLQFGDERYRLEAAVATDDGGTARAALTLVVDNWWEIDDALKAPMNVGFFGTVDQSRTSAESPGWEYATDRPGEFGGDADRKVRKADTAEYLVWETPDLVSFDVTVYAASETLDGVVRLSVATGAEDVWREVRFDSRVEPLTVPGWFVHRLSGTIPRDEDSAGWIELFRLDIIPGVVPAQEVQIGHVRLVGRNGE